MTRRGTQAVEGEFKVTNMFLKSKLSGVMYRKSPDLDDKCKGKVAKFDETISGVQIDDEWVQVGKVFLPMNVAGHCVLYSVRRGEEPPAEDQGVAIVHPALAWRAQAQQLEEQERQTRRAALEKRAVETQQRWAFVWARGDREDEPEEVAQGAAGTAEEQQQHEADRGPRPEPGTGHLHEVCSEQVETYRAPGEVWRFGPQLQKGMLVELFWWDDDLRYRVFCYDPGKQFRPSFGWVLVTGPSFLRPLEFCQKFGPLDPVRVAVHEDDLRTLKRCVDKGLPLFCRGEDGRTPLAWAAAQGKYEFCALLLSSSVSATPGLAAEHAVEAAKYVNDPDLGALIAGLSGAGDFDGQAFDRAMLRLRPEVSARADEAMECLAEQMRLQRVSVPPAEKADAAEAAAQTVAAGAQRAAPRGATAAAEMPQAAQAPGAASRGAREADKMPQPAAAPGRAPTPWAADRGAQEADEDPQAADASEAAKAPGSAARGVRQADEEPRLAAALEAAAALVA